MIMGIALLLILCLMFIVTKNRSPRHGIAQENAAQSGLSPARVVLEQPTEQTKRLGASQSGEPQEHAVEHPPEDFNFATAQAATRVMVLPIPQSYADDFRKEALSWPEGVTFDVTGKLLSDSLIFNPQSKVLGEMDKIELDGIVSKYNTDLEALAHLSYVIASDAMEHYFSSSAGIGWRRQGGVDALPQETSQRGIWSRNLILKHNGWERRIAFDSADYDYLETHLQQVRQLKAERAAAVRKFFENIK